MQRFPSLNVEAMRGRSGVAYTPDQGLLEAARIAMALQRPLLLTGKPGCGKTDFAWAAASALGGRAPLQCYVRSDTRSCDLLYHYDAVRRFADAQFGDPGTRARAQDPRSYVELQPLGLALMDTGRPVVLIDEIDKAPRDLPNDLLRELEHGEFEIREIPHQVGDVEPVRDPHGFVLNRCMRAPEGWRPLVVITSNIERQLPDAFLRRCVFYHIPFPEPGALKRIIRAHTSSGGDSLMGDNLVDALVTTFERVRKVSGITKEPATAELIDWARAVFRLSPEIQDKVRQSASGKMPWPLPASCCLLKLCEDADCVRKELA